MHAVKAFEADLIVMGTHRHTVVKGTLLGNTALKVLHDATIPVVMVRIPEGYHDHDRGLQQFFLLPAIIWSFWPAVASLARRLEGLFEPEVRSAVTQWVALGWPAVVRRQQPGTCAQTLSVGFPLALNRGRRRVGIEVGLEEVARVGSAPCSVRPPQPLRLPGRAPFAP